MHAASPSSEFPDICNLDTGLLGPNPTRPEDIIRILSVPFSFNCAFAVALKLSATAVPPSPNCT